MSTSLFLCVVRLSGALEMGHSCAAIMELPIIPRVAFFIH
jgi:hypothetical protein